MTGLNGMAREFSIGRMKRESPFVFSEFVETVFAPEPGERVLVLVDEPTERFPINDDWAARFDMAERWREGLAAIGAEAGFEVLPLLRFAATGTSNGVFPRNGTLGGETVSISEVLGSVSLVISLTEYSMSGALIQESMRRPGAGQFRAASAPLARADMEDSCLNIDYSALKARCDSILDVMRGSTGAEVTFSTGDRCFFDLRHREAFADDGYLHRDKSGPPLINLPSGEVWEVPYEGEIEGDPSATGGRIPIAGPDGSMATFIVDKNRIVRVEGDEAARRYFEKLIAVDPMRRNIGELAFGCNDGARVSGLFIEDEKAGLHWGLGRSEFLGGTVGVDAFRSPETVLHLDTPYAEGCPVTVQTAVLLRQDGSQTEVIRDGHYCAF